METVSLELSRDAAVVLFDWLARFNETGRATFIDQAEERVLWDLQADLETRLGEPLTSDYDSLLTEARDAVRDSID